jgi:Fur family transcriptional regulator, peroxide stress response regulator
MKKGELRAAFHRSKMRLTRQRLAIYRELAGRYDHPDVETLFRAVKPKVPQISLFTVYRTMNALEGAGMVWRVATFKGHARYDGDVETHAHFLCETCGKIDDVDTQGACHGLQEQARGCVPDNDVRRVDVMISGECSACVKARESAAKQA